MTKCTIWGVLLLVISSCGGSKEIAGCTIPFASNYNANATLANNCSCQYNGLNSQCGVIAPSQLIVAPVRQETEVWCWLAVGEMIFKYYGLPNVNPVSDYQCGIVGAIGYAMNGACDACNINCGNCIRPAGSPDMISRMLSSYPKVACKQLFQANKTLSSQFVANFLVQSLLVTELDAKRPIIAGINPGSQFVLPGNSQHVALIVGYHYSANILILHINDPYPYLIRGVDPYVLNDAFNNGNLSYQIPYGNFVNGLKWNTSWFGIGY